MRDFLICAASGVGITLLLLIAAILIDSDFSRVLMWQNSLLQSMTPQVNIGTPEHPIYEGTPLNVLALVASVPLGFLIYGLIAYFTLKAIRRAKAPSSS